MKRKAILVLLAAMLMIAVCATASATTTYYVTGDSVRVRTGPGTDYEIMYHVSRGDKVQVDSISHGWATIVTNSKGWQYYGYISSKYISRNKPTSTYVPTTTTTTDNYRNFSDANYYVIVNPANNYVNMRWEASKSSQVRRVYYYGARLKVIAENGTWCQVMDESTGEVGFILKSLLLRTDNTSATGTTDTNG